MDDPPSATTHRVDFARDDVDVAGPHGDGNWPGLEATRLCAEQIFAICSPKLIVGRDRLRRPADLLKWPLLRLEDQSKAWEWWFALAGVTAPERLPGPVLNRASMLIDAAIDGQGVALARTTLAAWDLMAGGSSDRSPAPIGSRVRRRRRRKLKSVASATGCWPRRPTIPGDFANSRPAADVRGVAVCLLGSSPLGALPFPSVVTNVEHFRCLQF